MKFFHSNNDSKVTAEAILAGDIGVLEKRIFSESELKSIAEKIEDKQRGSIARDLILGISSFNRNYDWNVGSLLQHFDVNLIVSTLEKFQDKKLVNSIGLAWVLGEFKSTSRVITDFLYLMVEQATDSDAWWRAAFSLEKLGLEEAVNLLKMSIKGQKLETLDFYLEHLADKRSVISILVLSNVDNLEKEIYPKIKKAFLTAGDISIVVNCCWLIGRLRLIDNEISTKLLSLIAHQNYELRYYTFFALQNNATEKFRPVLEKALNEDDPLIRKMAVRGLLSIGNDQTLSLLKELLYTEKEESVIAETSKAIYHLKNPFDKNKLSMEIKSYKNENGMISDESDKWYSDPSIYNIFSEAEDPENICFQLIEQDLETKTIENPVDIATGTGRMMWQIIDNLQFQGKLLGVDASERMCHFLRTVIRRERKYTSNIDIEHSTIIDLPTKVGKDFQTNFIISSFGFPSKISNPSLCLEELKVICSMLSDDGVFFTIGWDESFNDELNMMWFRYIPDNIQEKDFESWRKRRASSILSPRNCGLTWFKKGLQVPLQFSSIKESAYVMGYLFGRDAAQAVIKSGKVEWMMSLGITRNTKAELEKIIESHERN